MDTPSGVIALWFGAIGSIPAGWLLCDGANGTPDLRDKFVVGAGLTYAVGATGGTVNHTHPFTGAGHTHILEAGLDIAGGANISATSSSTQVTGTTDATDNLPPYHALAYIMKS